MNRQASKHSLINQEKTFSLNPLKYFILFSKNGISKNRIYFLSLNLLLWQRRKKKTFRTEICGGIFAFLPSLVLLICMLTYWNFSLVIGTLVIQRRVFGVALDKVISIVEKVIEIIRSNEFMSFLSFTLHKISMKKKKNFHNAQCADRDIGNSIEMLVHVIKYLNGKW